MHDPASPQSPLDLRTRAILTWSIRLGVILPVIYYFSRRYFFFTVPWELPAHSLLRQVVAAGLALTIYAAWSRHVGRSAMPHPPAKPAHWPLWVFPLAAGLMLGFLYFEFLGVDELYIEAGDEIAYLNHVASGALMPSEPLGRWSHHVSWRILGLFGEPTPSFALRASSVAAGMAYLAFCLLLTPRLFPAWPRMAALFIWGSPAMLIFLGYPETTPWAWALSGAYLLLGVDYLRRRPPRAPWLESCVLMLAVATHGVVLFMTAAHLALLWSWWHRDTRAENAPTHLNGRRLLEIGLNAALPFALLGSLIAAGRWGWIETGFFGMGNIHGGGDGRRWVLLTGETVGNLVRLFNADHLTSLINLALAGNALVLITPFAIRDLVRRERTAAAFLSLALGGMIFFAIAWNADWGMLRDLDLFIGFALPTQMIIALWWDARLPRRARLRLAAAVLLSTTVWLVLPFARHFGPFLRHDDPFLVHVFYLVLGSSR